MRESKARGMRKEKRERERVGARVKRAKEREREKSGVFPFILKIRKQKHQVGFS